MLLTMYYILSNVLITLLWLVDGGTVGDGSFW